MDKSVVITILRQHEAELRRMGVMRLSLFGSVARGEAGPESDVDVAVSLDPVKAHGGLHYIGVLEDIRMVLEGAFHRPVDVIDEAAMKKIKGEFQRDRVVAF